jgi:hypothetical protein
MKKSRNLPNFERLSILTAIILLSYAIARLVNLPGQALPLQFAGIYLALQINARTIIGVAVAGLMATGMDWLLRDHPKTGATSTIPHWILPSLTAWVITVPLNYLPVSPLWWGAFAIGGFLLVLILIAEYVAIDPDDIYYPAASIGLITLSFVLFLILAISLRSVGLRLLLSIPPLSISSGLVALRAVHLRTGKWQIPHAMLVILITAQITSTLHYLPLSPTSFGLLTLAPAYTLTHLTIGLDQIGVQRRTFIEPIVVFFIFLIMAIWLA